VSEPWGQHAGRLQITAILIGVVLVALAGGMTVLALHLVGWLRPMAARLAT